MVVAGTGSGPIDTTGLEIHGTGTSHISQTQSWTMQILHSGLVGHTVDTGSRQCDDGIGQQTSRFTKEPRRFFVS